jgi:hypothetical protein
MAASLLSLVVIPSYPAALVILVAAGLSWTSTISTLVAELQLFLPRWVMARGMAIWTMIFTGCQAVGALIWGLLANRVDLVATFATASVSALVAVGLGLVSRVPDASADDQTSDWLAAMQQLRRSRPRLLRPTRHRRRPAATHH